MRKLRIAFSKKEKGEQLLSKLEELEEEGELEDAQYETMKEEYGQLLGEGNSEIKGIKEGLTKTLEATREELESYSQELKNLEVRIKVGELSTDKSRRQEKKLRTKVEKLKQKAEDLESLLSASSSDDLGGFIDIPSRKKAAGRTRKRG